MAYTKTVWSTGDTITASLANHWETQYDEVKAEVEKTDGSSDIKPHWSNIGGKPASFTPNAHKSTHATGGSDELTPTDIGAETPAGAQAKADAAAGTVQADLDSHKAEKASVSVLGHVKQGARVTIDGNGVISADIQMDFAYGSYTGDGTSNRTITVGFTPKIVLLFSHDRDTNAFIIDGEGGRVIWSPDGTYTIYLDSSLATGVSITTNGFIVSGSNGGNYNSKTYRWKAWG